MRFPLYLVSAFILTACNTAPENKHQQSTSPKIVASDTSLAFRTSDQAADGSSFVEPPVLRAQIWLDRLGFSPGVIDGKEGQSYASALRGFQESAGIAVTGKLDEATRQAMEAKQPANWAATHLVVIPAAFASGPFFPDMPSDMAAQADLPALGYHNLMEALSERFHTTPETLVALNSETTPIGANKTIRVPDIADVDESALDADARGWNGTLQRLAIQPTQPQATKVVVDKSEGLLKVYDAADKLIAQFPATMGSRHDPLPIGTWKIQGVSRNPDFHYNPKLFWDVSDSKDAKLLPPGPNSPVGVAWIDLSKPHYGIHGTSEPQTIGRTESHGCVRLTNWDAARLAQMVKPGTQAIFQN